MEQIARGLDILFEIFIQERSHCFKRLFERCNYQFELVSAESSSKKFVGNFIQDLLATFIPQWKKSTTCNFARANLLPSG